MKEIHEAIAMVQDRNNDIASDYIQKIMDSIKPDLKRIADSDKQDESLILGIYYRKGNDIRGHGYACGFDKVNATNTDVLTFREYFNQTVNLSIGELDAI